MEEKSKMEGTVNWFNIKKGYGFVKGEDEKDYFLHYSAVPQGVFLKEGDRISFEPAKTDKGEQAQNVQLLKEGEGNYEEQSNEETQESTEEQPEETQEEVQEEATEEQPAEESEEEQKEESEEEQKEESEEQPVEEETKEE